MEQEPMKVIVRFNNTINLYYICPCCNAEIFDDGNNARFKPCYNCGAMLRFPIGPEKTKLLRDYTLYGLEQGGVL